MTKICWNIYVFLNTIKDQKETQNGMGFERASVQSLDQNTDPQRLCLLNATLMLCCKWCRPRRSMVSPALVEESGEDP